MVPMVKFMKTSTALGVGWVGVSPNCRTSSGYNSIAIADPGFLLGGGGGEWEGGKFGTWHQDFIWPISPKFASDMRHSWMYKGMNCEYVPVVLWVEPRWLGQEHQSFSVRAPVPPQPCEPVSVDLHQLSSTKNSTLSSQQISTSAQYKTLSVLSGAGVCLCKDKDIKIHQRFTWTT